MTENLADLGSVHRFRPSSAVDEIYRDLHQHGLFIEKWQFMRLAVGMSLLDDGKVDPAPQRNGQDIRGETIFNRDDSLAAFATLVTMHAGRALSPDEIAQEVEAHWYRGAHVLSTLVAKAREEKRNPEAVILDLLSGAGFTSDGRLPPEQSEDPAEVLNRAIVGQLAAKAEIVPLLRETLESDQRVMGESILFTGPASTGKTLFSETISDILRLPRVILNGDTLGSINNLLERLRKAVEDVGQTPVQTGTEGGIPIFKYPPAVVFIDECHRLSDKAQAELLTAMEPKQRRAVTNSELADLTDITFLLATTDSNKLAQPLRTRCRTVSLEAYKRADVATIIARSHPGWPMTVNEHLALAGRLIPRVALKEARDFARYLQQERPGERASENVALDFMASRGMNSLGLVKRDYEYLKVLESQKPRGLNLIAGQLQIDEAEVEDTIEPYLLNIGFIDRSAKGRTITSKGLEYLHEHADEETT
jgi:Holliday junction resolvasome RuvABC ATP-dependent DNA helicase subunit